MVSWNVEDRRVRAQGASGGSQGTGRPFLAEAGEISGWPWSVLINAVAGSHVVPTKLRAILYRAAGLRVPLGIRVKPGVVIRSRHLRVGRGTSINYGCTFDNRAPVSVGDRCGIGIDVKFITSSHEMADPDCRAGLGSLKPILIGDGVWIGSAATILGGVTIGDGCVIAAGAVVTKDCASHGLYGGVPARLIRALELTQ